MNPLPATHGTPGLIVLYGAVGIPMLLGLLWGRASSSQLLLSPLLAAPLLLVAALVAGLVTSGWEAWGPAWVGPADLDTLHLVVMMVVGAVGGRIACRRGKGVGHQRGSLVRDGEAQQQAGTGPITLAGVAAYPEEETRHFKFIGTTGTGKSTVIRELLGRALARGDRAVIADPDGGYLSRFFDAERGDVILNPFDARSRTWDLFGEIQHAYDIEQLARSLIPDDPQGAATEWRSYARTFMAAITRQLRQLGDASLAELYRLLTAASTEELRILVAGTPAQPFLEESNARMFGSIRSVTGNAVAALEYIQAQKAVPLSVRDWVRQGKGILFMPYQADQIAALRAVIATWLRLAIFQTLSQGEEDHRIWFVIDELDALGRIDGLQDALARLRKFGGRCVLGLQSISQVSGLYGDAEGHTIIENCGNTLILRCSASEGGGTAHFASRLIGDREIIRQVTSRSQNAPFSAGPARGATSIMEQHATEPAVMASQIEQLPDRSGYLKLATRPEWLRVQFPPYDLPKIAEPFVALPS